MSDEEKIIVNAASEQDVPEPTKSSGQVAAGRGAVTRALSEADAENRTKPSPLRAKLSTELAGIAKVSTPEWLPETLGQYEIHAIEISDKSAIKRAEHLRKFLPYVGRLYYETFQDREKEGSAWNPDDPTFMEMVVQEYLVDCDLSRAEKIYLITNNEQVLGMYFLKYRNFPSGKRIAHVLITTLDKPCRGTMVNELISRTVLENEKVHAFTGVTHTPQLVKSWIRLGTMTDMDMYFCGRKNGDKREPISEREQKNIAEIMQYDFDKLSSEFECKVLPAQNPHYLNYGSGSIPARKLSEVRLSPDDPVYQTFEELITFQEEKAPGECMYGTIMMIRRE